MSKLRATINFRQLTPHARRIPSRGFHWRFRTAAPVRAAPPSWGRHPQTSTTGDICLQHNAIERHCSGRSSGARACIGRSRLFFLCPSTQPLRCTSIVYAAAEPGSWQSFVKAARSYARAAFLLTPVLLVRISMLKNYSKTTQSWKADEVRDQAAVQGAYY
jgi:hypothetical protein